MEEKVETTILLQGLCRVVFGLYKDNGKNGNYFKSSIILVKRSGEVLHFGGFSAVS